MTTLKKKKKRGYAFLMLLHKQESEEANGNKQTPHKNTPTIFLNKNLRPKKTNSKNHI